MPWRSSLAVVLVVALASCARTRMTVPPLPPLPMPTPVPTATPIRTVASVVATIGDEVHARLVPHFRRAGLAYPPQELVLVAFKGERRLEVWGRGPNAAWVRIHAYPILAASGGPGPKLRWGDRQVPEGIYRIVGLNPESRFHLSLALDYPNEIDRLAAAIDGRTELGGDIFIHGRDVSIGCLAMGDRAIEDLFVLVADVGFENVEVIIAPHDPARAGPLVPLAEVTFTRELYPLLEKRLRYLRTPSGT